MTQRDPAVWIANHPHFKWRDGMLDRLGARLVLDSWKHPSVEVPSGESALNLNDPATAGVLLALLDDDGVLSDVVRDADGWIVAIKVDDELEGYQADTLGEAAAWAILAWWGEDLDDSDHA